MIEKIKNYFRNYFRTSSKLKIAGDVFFYLFILLLIIPSTRKEVSTLVVKVTMRRPMVKEAEHARQLSESDFNFTFSGQDGKNYTLADFNGETIFLNFWATWCPPCRAEMPSIQKLYNAYQDKIAILLITSEESSTVQSYLDEHGYTFPVYFQTGPLPSGIPVSGIPATFLISEERKILVEKTGAANWFSESFRQSIDRASAN